MPAEAQTLPETAAAKPVSLWPLLYVQFISALGFSLALPFLVYLVQDFGGNSVVYGFVGATYSAFQFVGAPLIGQWSDRVGRKRALYLSQMGTFLSWAIFIVALLLPVTDLVRLTPEIMLTVPLLLLFLARAFDGLTGGNISVANAYMADVTPEEDRQKNFGRMGAAMNLGFMLGPALSGTLSGIALAGFRAEFLPVLAAALIALAGVLLIQFMLPESMPCVVDGAVREPSIEKVMGKENRDCIEGPEAKAHGWREALGLPGVGVMIGLYFIVFLGFNAFYATWPVFAAQKLEWTPQLLGYFFSALSVQMIGVQGVLLPRVSRLLPDRAFVVLGGLLMIGCFALLATGELYLVFAASTCFAFGNGLMWPSFSAMLSRTATSEYQGAVQGLSGSAGSLASIVGLIGGGVAYRFLEGAVFYVSAGLFATFLLVFALREFSTKR